MQIEVLNNFTGDNKVEIDTDSEDGRKKIVEMFTGMLRSGTAIFLERATETYRVTGYDPATDSLKVQVPIPVVADGKPCACAKCEHCKNNVRESSRTGICTACQQGKHGGRKIEVNARPRHKRGDRVTAVAPRAGG